MKALILAAGYGIRLYPLTKQYPKPLLEAGKKPIINYIIDKIELLTEIDEIVVVTNSKFAALFEKWAAGLKTSKIISIVDDLTTTVENRRGAIGDIKFSVDEKHIEDDLLVIGADNLFDDDLKGFLSFAGKNKLYHLIGAYDIADIRQADKYGVISVDKENKIIDFEEKPKFPKSTLVAMCLYFFPKDKLKFIDEYLKSKANKFDATGFYIDWLRKRDSVYAFKFGGRWYDIGDHGVYNKIKEGF